MSRHLRIVSTAIYITGVSAYVAFAQTAIPLPGDAPVVTAAAPNTAIAAGVALELPTTQVQAPEERYSFGNTDINSVFFSPSQVKSMKDALRIYEDRIRNPNTSTIATVAAPTPQEAPKLVEPDSYPVFHLSSIAYRNAGDWTVWVSGHKITSEKNTTDLRVIAVSPTNASFAWSPTYIRSIDERIRQNQFAPLEPVKHRLVKEPALREDESLGVIYFTLRPNQSFAVGYYNIFEGLMESPKLAPIAGPATTGEDLSEPPSEDIPLTPTAAPSVGTGGAVGHDMPIINPDDMDRNNMDAMIRSHDARTAAAQSAAAKAANPPLPGVSPVSTGVNPAPGIAPAPPLSSGNQP